MKLKILTLLIILLLIPNLNLLSQTNYINDAVLDEPIPAQRTIESEIVDIVILAVDSGASKTIPTWFYDFMDYADDFMRASTFENYSLNIVLLGESPGQAFEMPKFYVPTYNSSCS